MSMKGFRFLLMLGCALTLAIGVIGCQAASETTRLRVVHASPDAPAIDVYIQGRSMPLVRNLKYGDSSVYRSLLLGSHRLEIRRAGDPASAAALLTSDSIDLNRGERTTAIVAGLAGSTNTDDRLRMLSYEEHFDATSTGSARVRFLNAAPDAPTLSIDIGDDGDIDVHDLDRWEISSAGGERLDITANQPITLRTQDDQRLTTLNLPALPDRGNVFVIITGEVSGTGTSALGFIVLGPAGILGFIRQNTATVYILHAVPDAPPVDIYAGTEALVTDLAFGELSGALHPLAAAQTLSIQPHQGGGTAGTFTTPVLQPGERYLVIATGLVSSQGADALQLIALRDAFTDDSDNARLRGVHASPDAPAVDIGTLVGTTLTPLDGMVDLAFTDSSPAEGVRVEPGNLTLAIAPTGSSTVAATFQVSAAAGQRWFGVIAGLLNPLQDEEGLTLLAVDSSKTPWTVTRVDATMGEMLAPSPLTPAASAP